MDKRDPRVVLLNWKFGREGFSENLMKVVNW